MVVIGTFGRPVDDDHVSIRAEVHFPTAVPSHADDGDPRRSFVDLYVVDAMLDGPLQRCFNGRVVYVGHAGERCFIVDHATHPSETDAFDFVSAHGSDGVGEIVDVAGIAFKRRLGLNVEAFSRTWLQRVVVAEPCD